MTDLRTFRRVVLVALLLVLLPPASAGAAGPLFDYREVMLDNGLRIITLEDFSCPVVTVHLWYHVGSKDEDPQRQGFAHMFEHMMFRGTDRLGPTDHFDYIRRTGGTNNAYTAFDQTVYHETLPANQLELALWLEAERMAFLKIDQEAFATERQVVEEERRLGVNRPYGLLPEKILAELFREHPYRWTPIGNIAHLRSASVPELRDFWTRYYVPNNATLVIVGAVAHDQAQALARRYFGWIPRYPDPPRVTIHEPEAAGPREVTFKEDSAPAPLVGLIFRTVPSAHPDDVPLDLVGTILGGGMSSRLYRELVAEKELAVMAVAGSFALEQEGLFGAGAVLAPLGGDPDAVKAAIQAQIERLRTEPVSEQELTKARNQRLKSLVLENLTVVSKAAALGSAAVLQGDVARVNRRLDEVRRVTAADLQRVAQAYLTPERAMIGRVEQNVLGSLGGLLGFKKKEEDPPVTAEPETDPPPPGRPNLSRPPDFPTTAPVAAALPYDPTPRFVSATLPNGLKLLVVENRELPFITIRLGLRAGAWTESQPGTAAMALGMLTRGTRRHSEGELASELETYAIDLSGSADMDDSSVVATCLTEHVGRAVELLAEVVRMPTFPDSEFETLRRQVRTGLEIAIREPSYIADRELRRRLYGRHPYARTPTGEIDDLEALTPAAARAWWQRFARPDQATLIFAGDIGLEQAQTLAAAHLGEAGWHASAAAQPSPAAGNVEQPSPAAGAAQPPPAAAHDRPAALPAVDLPPIPEPAPTHIYLVDRPGVQSQIRLGGPGLTRRAPEYFISRVLSGYFGGAFSSRLNETIRVKKGLTYGASGGFSAQRLAGEFQIGTFSKTERTVEAVQAIFEELERLREQPPTADELGKTKAYILGSFPAQRETPQQVAGDLWLIASHDLPADYLSRLLAGVAQTTAEACVELAQRRVDPDRLVVVVVGPAEALRSGLAAIAPVTVIDADGTEHAPAGEEMEQAPE